MDITNDTRCSATSPPIVNLLYVGTNPEIMVAVVRPTNCLVTTDAVEQTKAKSGAATLEASKNRRPRSVRFAVDKHGKIATQVVNADVPLEDRLEHVYWSKDEKDAFRRRAHREAKLYKQSSTRQIKRLVNVYTNGAPASRVQDKEEMELMLKWASGNGRGLENRVSSVFKEEQGWTLLEIVLYYRHLLLSHKSASDITKDMAKFSREKTSKARAFATKMAQSDAYVVETWPAANDDTGSSHAHHRAVSRLLRPPSDTAVQKTMLGLLLQKRRSAGAAQSRTLVSLADTRR
jgi:hypothetical protein